MPVIRRTFLSLLLLALAPAMAAAQDYVVIVHPDNAVDSLSKDELSKLFFKRMTKWKTGGAVAPVDQLQGSPVRAAFSKSVLGKPVGAVVSFWQQQIFAGRDVPPVEKANDGAVVAFVKANAGAIGYVSSGSVVAGVKVVPVR